MSLSFISLIERGKRAPSYETLLALADTLGVPVSVLVPQGRPPPPEPHLDALLDFVRKARLSPAQVKQLLKVGSAMFPR